MPGDRRLESAMRNSASSVWRRWKKMQNLLFIGCIVLQTCMMSELPAAMMIHISVTLGDNVTLRLPERGIYRNITDVTWVRADGNHFATTTPDGKFRIRDDHYNGRLYSLNDASLIIMNVTAGEHGVYTANIVLTNEDNYDQNYNLSILARSPDKVNMNDNVTSMLGACSMSCRGDGRHVTLTCGQTSPKDISEVYDPDTCTCGPWDADCAPCVLEQYCGKGGDTPRNTEDHVVPLTAGAVSLVLVLVLVISALLLYYKNRKFKEKP